MDPIYIALFLPLFVIILTQRTQSKKNVTLMKLKRKKRSKEKPQMLEIAKRFIDKDSMVYLFDGNTVSGTVKDVQDGAILIERVNASIEIINLDYVVRIREYPKTKSGKKKSVVID